MSSHRGRITARQRAMQVGPPDQKYGQPTRVAPACTWTSPTAPAAEVAAHAAAALALSSHVTLNQSAAAVGTAQAADWLFKAQVGASKSLYVASFSSLLLLLASAEAASTSGHGGNTGLTQCRSMCSGA
jgi:hypothetical protein